MTSRPLRTLLAETSSEEYSKVLAYPKPSYKILYYEMASVAATARDLLAYGKVQWENVSATDKEWFAGVHPTPFKVMPILSVVVPGEKELIVSESVVIDQYLAKKFHLLGDNEWEELTIRSFYANIHYLRERTFTKVSWTYVDKRKESLDNFLALTLPGFIHTHEFHLRANGSNGHYVGSKLSLADIHLANVIDHFTHLPGRAAIQISAQFRASELLWKVKEQVEKDEGIAAWRATELFKTLAVGSAEVYTRTSIKEEEDELVAKEQ